MPRDLIEDVLLYAPELRLAEIFPFCERIQVLADLRIHRAYDGLADLLAANLLLLCLHFLPRSLDFAHLLAVVLCRDFLAVLFRISNPIPQFLS